MSHFASRRVVTADTDGLLLKTPNVCDYSHRYFGLLFLI
jgi:hypothetical protein